eukprot:6189491-Pleurochrysis_carterae.AAC.1
MQNSSLINNEDSLVCKVVYAAFYPSIERARTRTLASTSSKLILRARFQGAHPNAGAAGADGWLSGSATRAGFSRKPLAT